MTNETLRVINRRRSIRAYIPRPVERDKLSAIVEAGQYAPNGGGEAWHFTVVTNADVIERINVLAKQYAATCGLPWLEQLGRDDSFHSFYRAPAAILVSGDANNICAVSDTAAATENMLLAAESLGLGSCWGYFATQAFLSPQGEALRDELQIPDGYTVYTSVMIGAAAGAQPDAPPRKPGCVTYIE